MERKSLIVDIDPNLEGFLKSSGFTVQNALRAAIVAQFPLGIYLQESGIYKRIEIEPLFFEELWKESWEKQISLPRLAGIYISEFAYRLMKKDSIRLAKSPHYR